MDAGMGGMGGFGDIMNMMQQAQQQAKKMREELDRKLAETVVEGSAGGGMVTVTMTGAMQVKDINIEKDVVNPDDIEMLEDLVVAAFNQALKKASEEQGKAQQGQMGDLGQQLGGLPGMGGIDLSKMFGG